MTSLRPMCTALAWTAGRFLHQVLAAHLRSYPAKSVTLPWRDPELGKPVKVHLIVTTRNDSAMALPSFNARSRSTARRLRVSRSAVRSRQACTACGTGMRPAARGCASPVEVSACLGHSDVAFTMRTYGHLMESSAERAGQRSRQRSPTLGRQRKTPERARPPMTAVHEWYIGGH